MQRCFLLATLITKSFTLSEALFSSFEFCAEYRIREVLSEALFSSFEFCADGFVDDTDGLSMMDDDSLPWGTLQCAGKLAGHRLLVWSFYALILVFPVILYFLFGSWFKSQLGSLVSAAKGSYLDIFWI